MESSGGGQFRFQNLDIWKRAAALSLRVFELADALEKQRLFRFAEQLRAACLSITNNIAEGSGSSSKADFANFLNFSRRSVFEVANVLMLLSNNGNLQTSASSPLLAELEQLSRMIHAFSRTLKSPSSPGSKLHAPGSTLHAPSPQPRG
jgi:four helix bundle protein